MKNLIRTMISGIAYLRSLFPEDFFRDEVIGGLHVKLLLAKDAAARRLTSWVEDGVFDAFDRGYLSEAVLGVYLDEGAPRRLAESYSFRVRYSTLSVARAAGGEAAGQASVLHPGKEDIHRAITEALRKQVVQSGVMRALPAEKFLTLKLIYTEDTPQDYRPKAADFRPTAERLTFDGAPETCLLGRVATQFHTLGITSFAAAQPPHESRSGVPSARLDEGKQYDVSDITESTPSSSGSLSPPSSAEEGKETRLRKRTGTTGNGGSRTSKRRRPL